MRMLGLRNSEPPNEAVERPILARSVVTPLVAGAVPPRAATGVPRTAPEDPFVLPTLPRVVARALYVEVCGQQWYAPRQDVLVLPVNGPYPVRPWLIRHLGTGKRYSLGHDLRKQYHRLIIS